MQTNCITRPALLAVEKIISTTNPADPTIITVKLFFLNIIIEEFADVAEIFSHFDATVCANLSNRLLSVTN